MVKLFEFIVTSHLMKICVCTSVHAPVPCTNRTHVHIIYIYIHFNKVKEVVFIQVHATHRALCVLPPANNIFTVSNQFSLILNVLIFDSSCQSNQIQ